MNPQQSKIARIGASFIIVILAGLLIWKFGLLEPNVSSSPLTASPAEFDFGDISMAKGNVSTSFLLKNEGSDKLKITNISTSCMCTTATIDGVTFGMHQNPTAAFEIKGGESKEIIVTFDPNAHGPEATGPISRIVFIKTNSEKTPQIEVRATGNVIK